MLCGLLAAGHGRAQAIAGDDAAAPRTAHIGVLAYRGNAAALAEWRRLDFLITNPGHYVALAARHDLSAIATRERWAEKSNSHLSRFGTAIIVARDSPVASLNDLKGRKVAAVSPDAFGGFQVAWSQMQKQGVDAFRDLASLRFMGFPHDEIVAAVARKEVDAGVIRAGLLEILAGDGQITFVAQPRAHRGEPEHRADHAQRAHEDVRVQREQPAQRRRIAQPPRFPGSQQPEAPPLACDEEYWALSHQPPMPESYRR